MASPARPDCVAPLPSTGRARRFTPFADKTHRRAEAVRFNPPAQTLPLHFNPPDPHDRSDDGNRPFATSDESGMTKTKARKRNVSKGTTKSRRTSSKPSRAEQRTTERTQLFAAATLYTELNPDAAYKVWVTNLSLGGVGFQTRREYHPGQTFHIKLEAGPIDMDCALRVVWTKKNADGLFEVGGEFLPD